MFCPNCGLSIRSNNWNFCGECGLDLRSIPIKDANSKTEPKLEFSKDKTQRKQKDGSPPAGYSPKVVTKKKTLLFKILLVAFGVILFLSIAFYFLRELGVMSNYSDGRSQKAEVASTENRAPNLNKEILDHAWMVARDNMQIKEMITSLYSGLSQAYNGGTMNTDSLFDAYYEKDVRYVTAWGGTELLDSTKARLRNAVHHVKDFTYRIEDLQVKPYAEAAYAFFVLRQYYKVDGSLLEEYLPTTLVLERRGTDWKIVHAHRSTDYETIQQYVSLQNRASRRK